MIPTIGIKAPCEHICESNLFYIVFDVWFRYMAPRDSIFVMHMNCMYQSYNICSWMDAYNYGFASIHSRCLYCKIFWGYNKEVNHKIRFPPWFFFCIYFFIEIKSKYKKKIRKINQENCIPSTVYDFWGISELR